MDARFVREGIAADDRLGHLHALTGQGREQLARAVDLLRLDGRGVGELIGPHAKGITISPSTALPARSPIRRWWHHTGRFPQLAHQRRLPERFKTTIWQIWDSLPEPLSLAMRGPAIRRALRARYTLPAPARRTVSHRVEAAETASPRPMRKAVR